MVLAFTGHRPEKLPWGNDESDRRCQALKVQLRTKIEQEILRGTSIFCCGMARGCDFYFAEAVLALKARYAHIRLEAYLPCKSQPSRWPEADQERYGKILSACDRVYLLQSAYTKGCMLQRNRVMVDDADALMSVWDGSAGGTEAAVRYAARKNKPVIALWL